MSYKVIMPKAGMAMEKGKIVRWLKEEGDMVEKGEPLLEIETDKVNMEVESMDTGYLLKILHREGEEVPVVQTIGYIGKKGEKWVESTPKDHSQNKNSACQDILKGSNTDKYDIVVVGGGP